MHVVLIFKTTGGNLFFYVLTVEKETWSTFIFAAKYLPSEDHYSNPFYWDLQFLFRNLSRFAVEYIFPTIKIILEQFTFSKKAWHVFLHYELLKQNLKL